MHTHLLTYKHIHTYTYPLTHIHSYTPVQGLIVKIIGHCYQTGHISIYITTLPSSGRQQLVMFLLQLIVPCLQPHILLPQQIKVLLNLAHFTCTTNKALQVTGEL